MRVTLCNLCLLLSLTLILAACQTETRVVEMLVEVEVTRVVEKPVEVAVTRVVEKPVEVEVTRVVERVVEKPVEVTATQPATDDASTPTRSPEPEKVSPPRANVALLGTALASNSRQPASLALDDDPGSIWSSGGRAVQWFDVRLDKFYLIDRIELVVAQAPPGETSHQIWVSDASGALKKVREYIDALTVDGQTLSMRVDPSLEIDRVLILTTKSPSWVAWREVRAFGVPAQQPETVITSKITVEQLLDWPPIYLRGDLEMPVQITNAGDGSGRLFVVEQRGRIRIISDGKLLSTPFLDISEQVSCCGERGLLSVVFPPDYAEKRYFYVNYTNIEGAIEIVRYRLSSDPNLGDRASAETILQIEQPTSIHNGGRMAFGPDGYLYVGTGDGGPHGDPQNRGQDPGSLLGKILRIDVESGASPYAIPDDNPFVRTAGYRGEIWALGLRNPWGFGFDRQTEDLYIADVGHKEFEEVNYQPASSKGGENYGWAVMEGPLCVVTDSCDSSGLTLPVAGYSHSQGCAVVGGTVYRGSRFISLQGIYFYADFCSGHIWGLRRVGDSWQGALLYDAPFMISAIGEGEDGNLYVANYNFGLILQLSVPSPRANVALLGSASASNGLDSAPLAIDDDPESIWSAGGGAVQWLEVSLDNFYLIDRIELLVTQAPAGETSHQIWASGPSGALTKLHEYINAPTSDGQTLEIPVEPPLILDRVMVLTTQSPSWVAWREVRVFGVPAQLSQAESASGTTARQLADWPRVNLPGDLELPVQVTNAGDGSGRLFVVELRGRIRVISDGTLLSAPLLDISEKVSCCGEQGLLGVVFPPDYAEKRYFYINYTNTEGDTEIVRYRLSPNPNVADPDRAEVILRIDQPRGNHNGGHMEFGPDGFLYIGTGDGGRAAGDDDRSQDPGTLLGKMLRIDVESGVSPYAIPDDNPFLQTAGYRGEIWALGLRNPWGFSFDRQTGDLYIADVGEVDFEEINFQPASSKGGENYGWAIMEGLHCFDTDLCDSSGLTEPVAEYPHSQGCTVVSGTVYRGSRFVSLQGIYFYADFCSGRIWGLRRIGNSWLSGLLYDAPFRISSIGEDEDGNLYVANYSDGIILRLEGRIEAPTATPASTAVATLQPSASLADRGRQLFVERGCVACHVVSSIPEAGGTSGPALDGFGDPSKWPLIAGVLANTPDNAKRWILDPPSFKPDTAMLNVGLSDSDADAIVAFLRTLK